MTPVTPSRHLTRPSSHTTGHTALEASESQQSHHSDIASLRSTSAGAGDVAVADGLGDDDLLTDGAPLPEGAPPAAEETPIPAASSLNPPASTHNPFASGSENEDDDEEDEDENKEMGEEEEGASTDAEGDDAGPVLVVHTPVDLRSRRERRRLRMERKEMADPNRITAPPPHPPMPDRALLHRDAPMLGTRRVFDHCHLDGSIKQACKFCVNYFTELYGTEVVLVILLIVALARMNVFSIAYLVVFIILLRTTPLRVKVTKWLEATDADPDVCLRGRDMGEGTGQTGL